MIDEKDYKTHDAKMSQIVEESRIRRKEFEKKNKEKLSQRYILPNISSEKNINNYLGQPMYRNRNKLTPNNTDNKDTIPTIIELEKENKEDKKKLKYN